MASDDQNTNPNTPESDILGDIDPVQSDQQGGRTGSGGTAPRSRGSQPGPVSDTAEEDNEGVTGVGRRDSDRGRDDPQRNPRTGPIG